VPAKRYLCATRAAYLKKLSPASVVTLKLQGGPMSPDEISRFEAEPFSKQAIRVREWDDRGKIAGLKTADMLEYRALLEGMARAG
jgi:predicted HD phosphohydrolase